MNISERFAKPTTARRILLIQLGDIGDVVWFLPALRAVREAFPGASVSVLLREGNGSLLAATVSPPMVFEVRKGVAGPGRWLASSLRLVRTLRRERFDLVFDFRGDERGGYMAFLTGAPVRAALYYSGLPWLRNRLFTHLVSPTGDFPSVGAADLSLYILRAFGIEAKDVAPELALSDKIILRASQLLVDEGFFLPKEAAGGGEEGGMAAGAVRRGGWVTVNPFSRWSYKEWAPEKWVKIIDWLWRDFGIVTVLVGSPEEGGKGRATGLFLHGQGPQPDRPVDAGGAGRGSATKPPPDRGRQRRTAPRRCRRNAHRDPLWTVGLAVLEAAGGPSPRRRSRHGLRPLPSKGLRRKRDQPLPRYSGSRTDASGHPRGAFRLTGLPFTPRAVSPRRSA